MDYIDGVACRDLSSRQPLDVDRVPAEAKRRVEDRHMQDSGGPAHLSIVTRLRSYEVNSKSPSPMVRYQFDKSANFISGGSVELTPTAKKPGGPPELNLR